MRMTSTKNSGKERKRHWRILIFIIYFIVVLILQKVVLTNNLQKSSYEFLLKKSDHFSDGAITFLSMTSYATNIVPYLFFVAFTYNFLNIYKSFVLLMVVLNTFLFSGLFKLLLKEPRPFFLADVKIDDHGCNIGYGNPSGHAVSGTAIYLTLWHILFDSSLLRHKTKTKYISLTIIMLFLFTSYFGRFVSGTNSLDQLIFGFFVGLGIYLGIFFVLCVDVNNGMQFYSFMNIRNLIFFTINFLIFLAALLVYIFVPSSQDEDTWINTIQNGKMNIGKCRIDVDSQSGDIIYPMNRFQREAFMNIAVFLSNFGAFLGLKCEYYFTFTSNTQNWNQYNFEKIEKIEDSLLSRISGTEMQWNHTNITKSVIRLLVLIVISGLILLPFWQVSAEGNIVVVFLFKWFLPLGLVAFSMFYLFKPILRKLRLDNPSVFVLMNETA